jgi:hypothetical protein
MVTLFASVCFATLATMALIGRFGDVAGAAAAFASGWYILRLARCPDR